MGTSPDVSTPDQGGLDPRRLRKWLLVFLSEARRDALRRRGRFRLENRIAVRPVRLRDCGGSVGYHRRLVVSLCVAGGADPGDRRPAPRQLRRCRCLHGTVHSAQRVPHRLFRRTRHSRHRHVLAGAPPRAPLQALCSCRAGDVAHRDRCGSPSGTACRQLFGLGCQHGPTQHRALPRSASPLQSRPPPRATNWCSIARRRRIGAGPCPKPSSARPASTCS